VPFGVFDLVRCSQCRLLVVVALMLSVVVSAALPREEFAPLARAIGVATAGTSRPCAGGTGPGTQDRAMSAVVRGRPAGRTGGLGAGAAAVPAWSAGWR
jgi:hypothetical protein